jgi:hypothetical protein
MTNLQQRPPTAKGPDAWFTGDVFIDAIAQGQGGDSPLQVFPVRKQRTACRPQHRPVGDLRCRCAETSRLDGPESREYALGHLIEREVGDGVSRRLHDWGFAWWRCPVTGWQFESASHDDGGARWLRRLPYTSAEDYLDRELVARRAEEIAVSHRLVNETVVHRSESAEGRQAWSEAAARHKLAVKTVESPDWIALIQKIKRSDPMAVEAAIVYLEVDPWCFRSGYFKERILRELSRAHLDEPDKRRIRVVLVNSLLKGRRPRTEFSAMRRLARHVRSREFEEALDQLRSEVDPWQRSAVASLLEAVRSSRRGLRPRSDRRRKRRS